MANALVRARADLEAGRVWKARDRLTSVLRDRQDDEVITLLAEVYLRMGDLPKAGALLFVLGGDEQRAQEAIAAWRQRFGDADARWRSIPAPVRIARADQMDALRARVPAEGSERDLPARLPADESWQEGAVLFGCLLVTLLLAALVVIGAITVVRAVL